MQNEPCAWLGTWLAASMPIMIVVPGEYDEPDGGSLKHASDAGRASLRGDADLLRWSAWFREWLSLVRRFPLRLFQLCGSR